MKHMQDRIELKGDKETGLILVIAKILNNRTYMRESLDDLSIDPSISAGTFSFTPSPEAEVIYENDPSSGPSLVRGTSKLAVAVRRLRDRI